MIPRLVLTLAVAFAAAGAPPARAADIEVTVDGAALAFDESTPPDISERMALPAAPNSTATTYQGWSVRRLAGAHAEDITSALVTDANGRSESLTAADIYTGWNADGENGGAAEFPVLGTQGGDGLFFARPRRSAGDDGGYLVNNAQGTGADTNLYVQISTNGQKILGVGPIEPSTRRPKAGDAVTFHISGSVSGAAPGPLTYSWNFGDATPAGTVEQPPHAYPAAGTFPVQVTVTDSLGNHGQSPLLALVVGDPAPQTTATPDAGGTGSQDSLPTGPVDGGQAPAPGAGTGRRPRHSPGGPARHHQTPAKAGDRALRQATPTPTPAPGRRPSSGSSATPGRPSRSAGGRDRKSPPAPAGTPVPSPPAATFGVLVGASAPQAVTDPAAVALAQRLAAARKALAHDQKNDAADVLDTLLGAAAALIVLALGALREFDPRARYRRLAT